MPVIQSSVSIAASAVNDNALVEFGLVGSATGLVLDVYSGQDTVAEAFAPSIQNRIPVYPDDYTLNDVAGAGERLKVRARNTTGGALTLFFSVRITPA